MIPLQECDDGSSDKEGADDKVNEEEEGADDKVNEEEALRMIEDSSEDELETAFCVSTMKKK